MLIKVNSSANSKTSLLQQLQTCPNSSSASQICVTL